VGAAREVQHDVRQGLVQGRSELAEAVNALRVGSRKEGRGLRAARVGANA
jgi:hypothetical protein